MKPLDIHDEWLSLIEVSGPFLATPVLKRVFSTGLPAVEPRIRQYLRQAYDEWCEARDNDDPRFSELHRAWIHEVLARGLEYDESDSREYLLRGERIPAELRVTLPEHGVSLTPDYALVSGGKSQLLVQIYPAGMDLQAVLKVDGWIASPAERMERLCRASGCRLGLVTDGERWMLVDAPMGAVSTFASWYARLWGQERLTLQAFLTLLGIRRFFGPDDETLSSMLDESLQHQEEVTDALGEQVRRAVEVLIQALDKEDRESSRTLLQGVEPTELYEAGLTIMMRLVFLLSAEERGLLLMGEEAYESNYAISTLRMQLRQETEEVLERRNDAWSRLLATFRAVYGGIEHEMLRLPALGGSLFDPDRFPFLEGRAKGSDWKADPARPLPIDNRTVLLLLEAIQQYEGRTLSYRALDVEQIGYVYEGLLERTVARTERVTVELSSGKAAKKTLYGLEEIEALHRRGDGALANALSGADAIRRGAGAIRKDLERSVDAAQSNRLLTACAGDEELRNRALPFLNLLRTDPWGYPLIYPEGAFIVTTGGDRRETGTHYTPKSLTESIVVTTLEPIAYVGPAEGLSRDRWSLKSTAELLDLKICDPAMGSGAFLVQVCRWLSERIVEAWAAEEATGRRITSEGVVVGALVDLEGLPADPEDRLVIARRLVAERCLYGVDLNPLAVELAKLSIWLVTLAKGRPFGFLDHNLKCGDSLLGIHRLDQLTELSMTPGGKGQQRLFGKNIELAVHEAIELRQRLREIPIRDIHDVEAMTSLEVEARQKLVVPECVADAFIGEVLVADGNAANLETQISSLSILADQAINGEQHSLELIRRRVRRTLVFDLSSNRTDRIPFHWPLEFPEVFLGVKNGFDAIVGNPPFLHGRRVSTVLGSLYLKWLCGFHSEVNGSADLAAYFSLRMFFLVKIAGAFGFIATKSIAEGDTRETSLDWILKKNGHIAYANPDIPWPGTASVRISIVVIWNVIVPKYPVLGMKKVAFINSLLSESSQSSIRQPTRLNFNKLMVSTGTNVNGKGFILTSEERDYFASLSTDNLKIICPYLRGEDVNRHPMHENADWIIDFKDMPEIKAREWPDLFVHLENTVKLERAGRTKQVHEPCFWKHWDKRPELYSKLGGIRECLVHAFVGKHIGFAFVKASQVIATPTSVWPTESRALFSVLQSSFHAAWVIERSSKMGSSIRYTASDCFQTFALPESLELKALVEIGAEYESYRRAVMKDRQEGLTAIYNRFHDSSESAKDIVELRRIHREMDFVVASAYGWDNLKFNHGFFETKQGVRYSIDTSAQLEVVDILLDLNQKRYMEEVEAGLHKSKAVRKMPSKAALSGDQGELVLLGVGGEFAGPAESIFNWLQGNNGWHAKNDILAATGVPDSHWSATINDLIVHGVVTRQGERRGTRYRAVITENEE